jgi:hypothetical protein
MADQLAMFGGATAPRMPALTFWRPWAESLVAGIKRLEYRHRPPPSTIVGVELAVVAGQHFDERALEWLRLNCGVDWRARDPASFAIGIVGVVTVTGWRENRANPAFGTCAWTLERATQIPPVGCPRAHGQGVRYVDGMERALVLERVAFARAGGARG